MKNEHNNNNNKITAAVALHVVKSENSYSLSPIIIYTQESKAKKKNLT